VVQGENIFFTGSAGTGKSVLLRAIIRTFDQKSKADIAQGGDGSRWELASTASTGISAM
jgi:ATP-dependent DNA helicase PIF1